MVIYSFLAVLWCYQIGSLNFEKLQYFEDLELAEI